MAGCTPQAQWDNIPTVGKLQILTLIGMLESYGEGAGQPEGYVHYTKGGQPGFYPEIKGKGFYLSPIQFNLWNPFDLPGGPSVLDAAGKQRGLFAEINNGRLAMIGLFSVLAESKVAGSNPQYKIFDITIPSYDGDIMGSTLPLTDSFFVQTVSVLAVSFPAPFFVFRFLGKPFLSCLLSRARQRVRIVLLSL